MPQGIRLQPLCCGRMSFSRHLFFPGEAPGVEMTIPVPAYLVRHPKGTLLVDTGIACGAAADPLGMLGERVARLYRLVGAADENVVDQLARQGVAPAEVTHIACSHLHFDHCGCNALFPNATVLLQRVEHAAATAPDSRYDRRLVDLPLDYRLLDGEHDVFGDGTVLLTPTPGHTAGHQSAIVQTARDRRFMLTADACYSREHLDRDVLPSVVWNAAVMHDTMARLRREAARSDTTLVFGHDATQWRAIEAAGGTLA